jgi:hypothetical protein
VLRARFIFVSSHLLLVSHHHHHRTIAPSHHPTSNILVVDHTTGRLQVFSPDGAHCCTRALPEVKPNDSKTLALSPHGQLAIVAHSETHPEQGNEVMVWM